MPTSDIMRRYPDSMANLAKALQIAERAWVIDNSGRRRRLLLSLAHGRTAYLAADLPDWATRAIPDELRRPR